MNELDYIERVFLLFVIGGGIAGVFGILGLIAEWLTPENRP